MSHLLKHQPQFLLGQFPCWTVEEPGRVQDGQSHTLDTLRVCHPSVNCGDSVVFDCQGAMLHSMKQQEEAFLELTYFQASHMLFKGALCVI